MAQRVLISVLHFHYPYLLVLQPHSLFGNYITLPGPRGHNNVGQPRMISTNTPVDVLFSSLIYVGSV